MNLLVAGGAGFIGTNLIFYLNRKYPGYKIVNLDNLITGKAENLQSLQSKKTYTFIKGDITEADLVEGVIKDHKIDAILNLATSRDEAHSILTDVVGTYVLLENARKFNIKRFLQFSTDEVYGETATPDGKLRPSIEDDPLRPQTPLSANKAAGDLLTFSFYQSYQIPITILRLSNIFGPYQDPKRLIPLLITQALKSEAVPIYGDGKHSRDFLFVNEACKVSDLVLHNIKTIGQIYNVSAGFESSILEVVELILTMLGRPKSLIEFVEDAKAHTLRRALDADKLRSIINWQPEIDLIKGLELTVDWYRENT